MAAGAAFGFDLGAGGDELLAGEADGEPFAAEEAGGGAGTGERVGCEHDRGGVPGRVIRRVVLAGLVEATAVEVHPAPIGAVIVAEELHPGEQVVGALVLADRVE